LSSLFFNKSVFIHATNLARILGVNHSEFVLIDIDLDVAYQSILGISDFSRDTLSHVSHHNFPLKQIVLHKIIIKCL